jgi:hypothetical protein
VKLSLIEQHALKYVEKYAQFLATTTGRGLFLVFNGLLAMSLILKVRSA